jgi:hypothetical protein
VSDLLDQLRSAHAFYWGDIPAGVIDLAAAAAERISTLEALCDQLLEGMEYAWVVIANGRACDEAQHDAWEAAKFRYRDEHWHPALDAYLADKEAHR